MYNWSVVVSRSDSAEYETLHSKTFGNDFRSKRNAQLFAESYVLDYISNADGAGRLEPFSNLPSSSTVMSGLEVTREYIKDVENDTNTSNLKCHYIVGNKPTEPWSLTVHKTHIFTKTTTQTISKEEMVEQEIEEERDVEKDVTVVVPGRFWSGSKTEKVKETIKVKVKKLVPLTTLVHSSQSIRVVKSYDVFTVSLLKTKVIDQISPIEKEQAILMASELAKSFIETKTAKMILAVSCSDVPYRVSELINAAPEDFGYYHIPEKKRVPKTNAYVPIETPKLNIRRATSNLGVKTNVGASLANLGAEIIKKRQEMFPTRE